MSASEACLEAQKPSVELVRHSGELEQNLLLVLTATNIALLFLVALLARRLEALHSKLSRFMKSSRLSKSSSSKELNLTPRGQVDPPTTPDVARDLVSGHVKMLTKTLSTESLKSTLSADDFASLQCMLGDEDGITM